MAMAIAISDHKVFIMTLIKNHDHNDCNEFVTLIKKDDHNDCHHCGCHRGACCDDEKYCKCKTVIATDDDW